MRYLNKIILIFILTFCIFSPARADDEWKNISYFKRIDYKMRVVKHDPPIVLEWDKLLGGGTLPDKLKPIAFRLPAICKDYDKWKSYCTDEYIYGLAKTKEEFENYRKINFKKDYPAYRFTIIFYEVDYLIDGEEYSFVACTRSEKKIDKYPSDMQKFIKEQGGVGGFLLLKENGVWKNHYLDNRLFYDGELEFSTLDLLEQDSVLEFSPYDLLTAIMEKGFAYRSKENKSTWPFEPSETLKTDSYIPTWHRYNYLEGRPPQKQDNQ